MSEQLALFGEPEPIPETTTELDEALIPAWFLKHQDRFPDSTPEPQFKDTLVDPWRQRLPQVMLLQIGPESWRLSVAAPPAASIDIYLTETQCKTIVKAWKSKGHGTNLPLRGGEIGLYPYEPGLSIRVFNRCGDIRQLLAGDLAEHTIDVINSRTLKKAGKPWTS